jgi:hypothetical protein
MSEVTGATDLERNLAEAKARLERASQALRGKHKGNEWSDYRAAHEELLQAERALCRARGEEYATPCPGFPAWDTGAPLPHLLCGVRGNILVYHGREAPDPAWDGRSVRVADVARDDGSLVVIVRFTLVQSVRVGDPNDEVISGHPLHGKGLAAYRAHLVLNSRWVLDLRKVNSVHSQYDPARWERCNHYLLAFHDETVECVAQGFEAEVKRTTLAKACRECLEEVMGTSRR